MSRRSAWHLKANAPVVAWLLLVLIASFVHPVLSQPRWLLVHLLLLGAVTNAILVWSAHFAEALLRLPGPPARHAQVLRLVLLNASVVLVVAGVETSTWPVTAAGAAGVGATAGWHGGALLMQTRRSLPSRFGATVRYYVAAAALLPVGATLGVLLARGPDATWHDRLLVAHAALNLLGWIGLTVVGTLVTLWPTMLRTRIADGAERAAARALVILLGSLAVIVAGALVGPPQASAAGLAGYLSGLIVAGRPLARAARRRPPGTYATWSVLAAGSWLAGSLVVLTVAVALAPDWPTAARAGWLTVPLAAGFAAQVLLGALSYLVPVVLGGGPSSVRAADTTLARGGALRITAINLGLLVCVLPAPSAVRVACSLLVLSGLAAFLPLLVAAVRASRDPTGRTDRRTAAGDQQSALVAVGLAAVVLAVAGGAAVDPSALAGTPELTADAGVAATGHTTRVEIEARHMRFTPSTVEVPAGDRLVIVVTNADHDVHDLVLETNHSSGRLSPGESATLDVGVVGRDLDGWCSVVGHRQMGMTMTVDVVGGGAPEPEHASDPAHEHAGKVDLMAEPDAAFRAHAAALPPATLPPATLPPATGRTVHRRTLHVREVESEVAPGVWQRLWTYNGTAPGPTLRGNVGDVFEITLVNDATIGHSVDFHAGALAPDRPMRTIAPGESLVYRFTARRSGIWLYHCSTMPMAAHIANGLFGAVIIDPPGLPRVDREYVVVQSEIYLGDPEVDATKLAEERPDLVVFNGYADQYRYRPLAARAGERVRIWVLAAGPSRGTSFHVVGGQFDTVFSEGSYLLRRGSSHTGGSQVLALGAAQGGFVELELPEPGHYPFLNHVMVDAERGAAGILAVRP